MRKFSESLDNEIDTVYIRQCFADLIDSGVATVEEKDGFKTTTRTFVSFDGQTRITSSESSLVIGIPWYLFMFIMERVLGRVGGFYL